MAIDDGYRLNNWMTGTLWWTAINISIQINQEVLTVVCQSMHGKLSAHLFLKNEII